MTSPCLGCGKPTVNRYNGRPCCYACEDCAESALWRLAVNRRTFGDFLPDPELLKRKPQMVR